MIQLVSVYCQIWGGGFAETEKNDEITAKNKLIFSSP